MKPKEVIKIPLRAGRLIYQKTDRLILKILKPSPEHRPYRPKLKNTHSAEEVIYKDFLKEHPSLRRIKAAENYILLRKRAADLARKLLGRTKKV